MCAQKPENASDLSTQPCSGSWYLHPLWALCFLRMLRSRSRECVRRLRHNSPYGLLFTLPAGKRDQDPFHGSELLQWSRTHQVWFVLAAFAIEVSLFLQGWQEGRQLLYGPLTICTWRSFTSFSRVINEIGNKFFILGEEMGELPLECSSTVAPLSIISRNWLRTAQFECKL